MQGVIKVKAKSNLKKHKGVIKTFSTSPPNSVENEKTVKFLAAIGVSRV
jgi:hypothetical protein